MIDISKELQRIHDSVPQMLKKSVSREVDATPDLKELVILALGDPDFPAEKKVGLKLLLDKGEFDKKKAIENEAVAKKIDQYITREIKKAVKEGRLPKTPDDTYLNIIKKINDQKASNR